MKSLEIIAWMETGCVFIRNKVLQTVQVSCLLKSDYFRRLTNTCRGYVYKKLFLPVAVHACCMYFANKK